MALSDETIPVGQKPGALALAASGVKEAMNANEEEFGMERLSKVFSDSAALGAEIVVKRVQEAVEKYSGEGAQMDDVTIVAIEKR